MQNCFEIPFRFKIEYVFRICIFELWIEKSFEKNISWNQSGMKIKIRLQKVVDPVVNVSRQTEAQKKQTETEKN